MISPFFLDTGFGQRFCLYHPPAAGRPGAGAVLYVHPFAEEMNKARRMAALQAGRFAQSGVAVLLIDLSGCGDSGGDFGDATWEAWNDDLAAAWRWLQAQVDGPIHLWGLRLGALLGLDFARRMAIQPASFLLWQPVTSGEAFLTQFLRLVLANEMLSAGGAKSGTPELRRRLAGGEGLEIAGYLLSANLARAIDALRLDRLTPAAGAVHWLEVVPAPGRPLPPGAQRAVDAWRKSGVTVNVHTVTGEPFWATQEITECEALLDATDKALATEAHGKTRI